MAPGMKCPVQSCNYPQESHGFCDKHHALWVHSPQRRGVDWTSDDSYDNAVNSFVEAANRGDFISQNISIDD